MKYFSKFRGQGASLPPKSNYKEITFAWFGGFSAIALVGYIMQTYELLLVMGSFGASCVLLFGFPKSPFSQPRNVIVGHLLSTFIGLVFLTYLGNEWWSMAMALATAIAAMLATRTVHLPAGSNPLIVFLLNSQWDYLLFPSLTGSVMIVVVALVVNNLHTHRFYPDYW